MPSKPCARTSMRARCEPRAVSQHAHPLQRSAGPSTATHLSLPQPQDLHTRALAAVAKALRPIDERLAHAWVRQQVERLLAPDDQPSSISSGKSSSSTTAAAARRSQSWWQAALPSVLSCIEPDELLSALTARLPGAGRSVEGQRALGGLAVALLRRSAKAARNTIERVRDARPGCGASGACSDGRSLLPPF